MKRRLALSLVLVASALGCMSPTQRREDDLMQNARIWNDDFRWGRWDIVGQSMTPEENKLFQKRKNLVDEDLVIVDYEVTAIHFLEHSQAATVDVKMQWYKKAEEIVRHVTLQQRWERRGGRWMMIKQRRVRGDRFPLVPEPAEAPDVPAAAEPDTESHPASPL
jgi:hypothetical protein